MTDITHHLDQPGHSRLGVFAVIIHDGQVLVGRRHYTKETWRDVTVWTMPGGRCDHGETVGVTLKREVAEEVGIQDIEPLSYIGEADGAADGDTIRLFHCHSNEQPTLMEPEKFSEWRWVPVAQYVSGEYGTFNPVAKQMLRRFFNMQ